MATTKKQASGDAELQEQKPTIDLSKFHYNGTSMSGDLFREYLQLVEGLDWSKHYDFEVYKVHPIKEARFDGVKDSPIDIVGIRIADSQPLRTTRITVKDAFEFNGRLLEDKKKGLWFTVQGGQFAENGGNPNYYGIYFLLKK